MAVRLTPTQKLSYVFPHKETAACASYDNYKLVLDGKDELSLNKNRTLRLVRRQDGIALESQGSVLFITKPEGLVQLVHVHPDADPLCKFHFSFFHRWFYRPG